MAKHQRGQREYDWLNDPFDDKKAAEDELDSAKMSTGSKVALGIGCLAVLIIVVAVIAISCSSMAVILGTPV